MTRRRSLSPDDQALWALFTQGITPLSRTAPPPASAPEVCTPRTPEKQATKQAPPVRTDVRVQADLDRKTARKIAGGRLPIDRRLDLHGLTQAQAHRLLIHDITRAAAAGARVMLVITGKGPGGAGVLRRNVPLWLEAPDLAPYILRYAEAQPGHGGAGALYVLLRHIKN